MNGTVGATTIYFLGGLAAEPAGQTVCYGTSPANFMGYCSSDARLKKDIAPITAGMLDAVMQLKPVTFTWKEKPNTRFAGFIAQDVQKSIPLAVRENPDGYYGLDATAIVSYLAGAIQELKSDNDDLRKIIAREENEIADLRREVRAQ